MNEAAGVYCIRNTRDGKVYIGSSCKVPQRLLRHVWELSTGRHANSRLSRAWSAHGAASFEFFVLARFVGGIVVSADGLPLGGSLTEAEDWFLSKLDYTANYNLAKTASAPFRQAALQRNPSAAVCGFAGQDQIRGDSQENVRRSYRPVERDRPKRGGRYLRRPKSALLRLRTKDSG